MNALSSDGQHHCNDTVMVIRVGSAMRAPLPLCMCDVHIKIINSKMSEKMNSREDVVNFAPGPAAIPTEVSIIKARF